MKKPFVTPLTHLESFGRSTAPAIYNCRNPFMLIGCLESVQLNTGFPLH